MKVVTPTLNKAAFYTHWGAKVLDLYRGKKYHNAFVLEVPRWILWLENHFPYVRYQRYIGQRKRLKVIARLGTPDQRSRREFVDWSVLIKRMDLAKRYNPLLIKE